MLTNTFIPLFGDIVSYEEYEGTTSTKDKFSDAIDILGKFENIYKEIVANDNKIHHATGFIMTTEIEDMIPQSKVTFKGRVYEVLSSEPIKSLEGFHHLEVYLR